MMISSRVTITDTDLGFNELLRDGEILSGIVTDIGILPEDAKSKYARGETLVTVAAKNEYGSGKIPERSFLRSTFDSQHKSWMRKLGRFMRKKTPRDSLNKDITVFMGETIQKSIKRTIAVKNTPPNKPRTIRRKGFNNPLIETRKLYRGIKFKNAGGIL